MLTEVIASEAQERLLELHLANQLLVAVPCTFLPLCFPVKFAFLVLSSVRLRPSTGPFWIRKMMVSLALLRVGMRWASRWPILALVLTGAQADKSVALFIEFTFLGRLLGSTDLPK